MMLKTSAPLSTCTAYIIPPDHSQLQLDIQIYYLSFCQPMALTSVSQRTVICYMSTYLGGKIILQRTYSVMLRANP